jgi:hypothetical protein
MRFLYDSFTLVGQAGDVSAEDGAPSALGEGATRSRRAEQSKRRKSANVIVTALSVAAAVGGAFSGVHPTGTRFVDPLYGAAVGILVTVTSSRATRETRLIFGALVVAASRGLILIPAVATLLSALSQVWIRRWQRRIGALVGAAGSQVILRWPHLGFLGLTTLVGVVAVLPMVITALGDLKARNRRRILWGSGGSLVLLVVLGAPVVFGALLSRNPATSGIAATRGALGAVSDGHASDASAKLRASSAEFATAHTRVGSWWSAGAQLIPVLSQQRRAVVTATGAAHSVATTAASEANGIDYGALRYRGGQINLAQVVAMSSPLSALDRQLASAQATLRSLHSPWLVSPIQSRLRTLTSQLTKATRSADVATAAVKAAPGLLGAQGARHYFVAFMTPAESRGLGGYMGAYGVLTVADGRISLTSGGATSQLPTSQTHFNTDMPGSVRITGPADYLGRYGPYLPDSLFGDLTYSPDLPTVNDVISQAYPQIGGQQIDGTLAIDPEGLAALLKITGPVTVPGLPERLSTSNATDVLLRQQYTLLQTGSANAIDRHEYLQDALAEAFPKLVGGSLPGPRQLSGELDPAVRAGHIQFWSSHPTDQPLLHQIGIDGAFPSARGQDLLAVTTSNSANNKTDAYLHRAIDDRVTYDPSTGDVTDHVTVRLRNDAPPSGLPSYVIGSYAGSQVPAGTNVTWLTVYSPLGITEQPGNPTDIRPDATPELGVNAYSAFVTVPPASSTTVSMTLTGRLTPDTRYSLHLRQQPMANPDENTVEIQGTAGWRPIGAENGRIGTAEEQVRNTKFTKGQ